MAGILFIISAPSGSGKSTLVNALRSQVEAIDFSVSWTTRKPRGSEQSGREYHFTTREEFERMVRNDEFLEHAEVFGNYYGTARKSLADAKAPTLVRSYPTARQDDSRGDSTYEHRGAGKAGARHRG